MKVKVKPNNRPNDHPSFIGLPVIMRCRDCLYDEDDCIYHPDRDRSYFYHAIRYVLTSKMQCPRFRSKVSVIKGIVEFGLAPLLFLLGFGTLKFLIGSLLFIPAIFGLDKLTDELLIKYYENKELKRYQEYENGLKRIEEEELKALKEGMSDEESEFYVFAKNLYSSLNKRYEEIEKSEVLVSKNGKRVKDKIKEVLKELDSLNNKLSIENIGTSYVKTLYKLHLVKLVELSDKFIDLLDFEEITDQQIIEYSNLLEVFRKKISDNQIYLSEKAEQDFIIKMLALNEDVDPSYSGESEVKNNV